MYLNTFILNIFYPIEFRQNINYSSRRNKIDLQITCRLPPIKKLLLPYYVSLIAILFLATLTLRRFT